MMMMMMMIKNSACKRAGIHTHTHTHTHTPELHNNETSSQLGEYLLLQNVRQAAWTVQTTDLPSATPASADLERGTTPRQRHAKVTESYYQVLIRNYYIRAYIPTRSPHSRSHWSLEYKDLKDDPNKVRNVDVVTFFQK